MENFQEQTIEFTYKGKKHKFTFTPEDSNEWSGFTSHGIVFDVHYDEEDNNIVVYEYFEELEDQPYDTVHMQKIRDGFYTWSDNEMKDLLEDLGYYIDDDNLGETAINEGFKWDSKNNVWTKEYAKGGRINIVDKDVKFDKEKYKGALGDFDNDGIVNIDDAQPLKNTGEKKTVELVELSKTFNQLLKLKSQLNDTMNMTVDELDQIAPEGAQIYARTKTPYSILKKLVDKRLTDKELGLTDLVGTTIAVDDLKDLKRADRAIKGGAVGKVIEREDMYLNPKGGYRAVHYLIESDDFIIEVQLKTKRQKELNILSHEAYKSGNLNSKYLLKLTDLANKADKGNKKAIKEFDTIMRNKKKVVDQLNQSFGFGGEITRSYDITRESGVGTYAVGGKVSEAGDTDYPSELLNYAQGGITIEGNPYNNEDFFIYRNGEEVVSWNADELMEDEFAEETAQEMFNLFNNNKKELSYRLENLNYAKGGKTPKPKFLHIEVRPINYSQSYRDYFQPYEKKFKVNSFKDASEKFRIFVAENNLGASNIWKSDILDTKQKPFAYVSYNGRVFTLSDKRELYDGRTVGKTAINYARGGKTQGYNSRLDESLGERTGAEINFEQKKKDRRDESKAMEKASGKRAYSSVRTMDRGNRMLAKGGDVEGYKLSVSERRVYHKYAEIEINLPKGVDPQDADDWLWDNEDKWEQQLDAKFNNAELKSGTAVSEYGGMDEYEDDRETRYDVMANGNWYSGGHLAKGGQLFDADTEVQYAKGGRNKKRDDMFLSKEEHEKAYSSKRKNKRTYKKRKK